MENAAGRRISAEGIVAMIVVMMIVVIIVARVVKVVMMALRPTKLKARPADRTSVVARVRAPRVVFPTRC